MIKQAIKLTAAALLGAALPVGPYLTMVESAQAETIEACRINGQIYPKGHIEYSDGFGGYADVIGRNPGSNVNVRYWRGITHSYDDGTQSNVIGTIRVGDTVEIWGMYVTHTCDAWYGIEAWNGNGQGVSGAVHADFIEVWQGGHGAI